MVTIRQATLEDLNEVHQIEKLCFSEGSYPIFVLRQFFDISKDYFIIAEEDGELLGYALGNLSLKDDQGWILSLGVHVKSRGKKIGKELAQKLVMLLENNNCKEICLTVHPENTLAIKIYEDLEFEIIIESDNYYLDQTPRYLMKKKAVSNLINS